MNDLNHSHNLKVVGSNPTPATISFCAWWRQSAPVRAKSPPHQKLLKACAHYVPLPRAPQPASPRLLRVCLLLIRQKTEPSCCIGSGGGLEVTADDGRLFVAGVQLRERLLVELLGAARRGQL